MTAFVILLIAAIPIHIVWLRRQRQSLLPPIGSRWLTTAYLSAYKVEVIGHHPFTGEITIVRVKVDDPLELRTTIRLSAKSFLSSSKPLREKK